MPKKNNITFNKPQEPEFIRKMKEKIGWKEGPTVETKLQNEEDTEPDYDHIDPQDEKPVVVVLKEGDLTAEEAEEIQKDIDLDDKTPGKFQFRKPDKSKQQSSGLSASTKRPRDDDKDSQDDKRLRQETTSKKDSSKSKQKSLLSFADEDEEEDT